jgi:hypothetical protein
MDKKITFQGTKLDQHGQSVPFHRYQIVTLPSKIPNHSEALISGLTDETPMPNPRVVFQKGDEQQAFEEAIQRLKSLKENQGLQFSID